MAGHGMIDRRHLFHTDYGVHLGDKRASLLLNGLPKGTPRAQNVSQLFEPIFWPKWYHNPFECTTTPSHLLLAVFVTCHGPVNLLEST